MLDNITVKKRFPLCWNNILVLGLTTTYAREGAEKVISSVNRQTLETLTWYKGSTDTTNRIAEASNQRCGILRRIL